MTAGGHAAKINPQFNIEQSFHPFNTFDAYPLPKTAMPINISGVHACVRFVHCGLDVSLTRYHETVRHVVSALPALAQLDGYVFLILIEE
jgi:hypothetical protein